jgi:hypothetical protein
VYFYFPLTRSHGNKAKDHDQQCQKNFWIHHARYIRARSSALAERREIPFNRFDTLPIPLQFIFQLLCLG